MGTEAPAGKKKPPQQPLPLRPSRVAAAWPGTPPRVTVPFLWEDAPGKPKAPPRGDVESLSPAGAGGADEAHPAPLKLPPRLQRVASAKHRDGSVSPRTVLHGPYYGCAGGKRPPRRTTSGLAAFRRMPSKGTNKNKGAGHHDLLSAAGPDAPGASPSASSSSSSSLSTSCFGDGHRDSSEEEDGVMGTVRITRFRRNRSLPSMTTSHLWASIRKSVKQITPWG